MQCDGECYRYSEPDTWARPLLKAEFCSSRNIATAEFYFRTGGTRQRWIGLREIPTRASVGRQCGVSDQTWPLFEQDPPETVICPSMLPATAMEVLDGAAPIMVPDASTEDPDASRAEPLIVPLTDAGSTWSVSASPVPAPGSRTVASSPDRCRSTSNRKVVFAVGVPIQSDVDVQKPFWHVAIPLVERVNARV
jgi:hypothetical protein